MKLICSFFISGHPMPAGSKKYIGQNKKTGRALVVDQSGAKGKKWREICQLTGKKNYQGELITAPILLKTRIHLSRPQGHYGKRGIKPSSPIWPTVKPDLLKLMRSIEDALTGIIWKDDSQIVREEITKRYSDVPENEGCRIWVYTYDQILLSEQG